MSEEKFQVPRCAYGRPQRIETFQTNVVFPLCNAAFLPGTIASADGKVDPEKIYMQFAVQPETTRSVSASESHRTDPGAHSLIARTLLSAGKHSLFC